MQVCFGPTESYRKSHNNLSSIVEARASDLDQQSGNYDGICHVALSAEKNFEAVLCIRWLHYTSSLTDHQELIFLPFDSVICVTDVVMLVTTTTTTTTIIIIIKIISICAP